MALLAGLIFAVSARTSHGTDLRTSQSSADLPGLVRNAEGKVNSELAQASALQRQITAETNDAAKGNADVATAQAAQAPLLAPAGLTPLSGPGISVVLNDASSVPTVPNVDLNQLVVHQSDLQAVVNALWAGGAEAMTVAGQRIIATSAVRCVGNTLLLNGRVFSPPYRVEAIGPYSAMHAQLDASPGVSLFRQAAAYYGLSYTVSQNDTLQINAYDGSVSLSYAKVLPK